MNQLVSLSFLDLMHEQKKSYLEIFKPIILSYIPEDGISLNQLCKKLNDHGILKIQYKTLEFFIRNMKEIVNIKNYKPNDYYVEFNQDININEIRNQQNKINDDINNDLNYVFDDFANFYQDKTGIKITINEAEKYITNFIQDNVYNILSAHSKKIFTSDNSLIVYQYILLISEHDEYKEMYNTVQKIIRGSIIAKEINNQESFSYKKIFTSLLNIVLDSNFIINLLGYGNKITVDATIELFNELKEINNIHFICYQNTYDEIYSKIDKYQSYIDNHRYIDKNDGIYGYFYSKKLRRIEIENILSKLKENIQAFGITFKELSQNDELEYNNYVTTNNIYNEIRKIKEEKKADTSYINEKSLDHDAFLFSVVVKNCNKHAKKLEDNRYIILTSDILLAKNNKEFSESLNCPNIVISDMQFAVKLFIHNSCKSSSLTINQILKYHANSLIIDNNIWDKIINIIEHMFNNDILLESNHKEEIYSKIKEELCFNSTLQTTLHDKNVSDDTLKSLIHNILSQDIHSEYVKNKQLIQENDELKQINLALEYEKQSLSKQHDEQKKINNELEKKNQFKKQTIYEKDQEIQNIKTEKEKLEISSRKKLEKVTNEKETFKKLNYLFIFIFCTIILILILMMK